eukprot:TRINITY_DN12213_c0_g1_i4.p1 TRINITY_DN12213_c0_g1~~TRINITY_DN12213_c0_g1_i4.p1  ORF type:complete len:353 (-),score=41.17 TRINITY_DN12213_c0_g1_i4:14-1072(-)
MCIRDRYLTYGLLMGFGHALAFPPGPVIISKWFPHRSGLATGIGTAGAGVGTMYLGYLARALMDMMGWRMAFLLLGVVDFAGIFLPGMLLVSPEHHTTTTTATTEHTEEPFSFKELLNPTYFRFRILCLSSLVQGLAWWIPMIHTVKYIEDKGFSSEDAKAAVAFIGAGTLVGRVLLMWLSDRSSPAKVYIFNQSLHAAANLLIVNSDSYAVLATYAFLIGWTNGTFVALVTPLTRDLVGGDAHLPETSGVVYSLTGVGTAIGPVVAGFLFEETGSYDYAYVGCSVLMCLSGVLMCFACENDEAGDEAPCIELGATDETDQCIGKVDAAAPDPPLQPLRGGTDSSWPLKPPC